MDTTTINPPEVLYHYCSTDTFLKVLKTRVIWLTHQIGMNDSMDTNWAVNFINDQFTQTFHKFRNCFMDFCRGVARRRPWNGG